MLDEQLLEELTRVSGERTYSRAVTRAMQGRGSTQGLPRFAAELWNSVRPKELGHSDRRRHDSQEGDRRRAWHRRPIPVRDDPAGAGTVQPLPRSDGGGGPGELPHREPVGGLRGGGPAGD